MRFDIAVVSDVSHIATVAPAPVQLSTSRRTGAAISGQPAPSSYPSTTATSAMLPPPPASYTAHTNNISSNMLPMPQQRTVLPTNSIGLQRATSSTSTLLSAAPAVQPLPATTLYSRPAAPHVPLIPSMHMHHQRAASASVYPSSGSSLSSETLSVASVSTDQFASSILTTFCAQSEVSQLTAVQEKEREILRERELAQQQQHIDSTIQPIEVDSELAELIGSRNEDELTSSNGGVDSAIVLDSVEVTVSMVDGASDGTAMDLCASPEAMLKSQLDSTEAITAVAPAAADAAEEAIRSDESPFGRVPSHLPSSDAHLWSTDLTSDIVNYWFATETRHRPSADYLQHQPDLNAKMREILIDWLVEVVARFRLQTETMFLSVALLDRFLASKAVGRKKLQLVGCVALLLASKYEEIYTPEINDFLIISDHAYERDHILHMESIMLNSLNFQLTQVTSLRFLQRFMNTPNVDFMIQARQNQQLQPMLLGQYLLELTLQFVKFLEYRPSTLAASVVYIVANHVHASMADSNAAATGGTATPYEWSASMALETQHSLADLQPCIADVYTHWHNLSETAAQAMAAGTVASGGPGNKCLAIFRKYGKERYGMVNQIPIRRPACI